jgi:transcriptional regulator with XRE-family HTH domain
MLEKILRLLDARPDLDQGGLEVAARLPQGRISKWKAGKGEPTAAQALRIARVLRVGVEYLVDDDLTEVVPAISEEDQRILDLAHELGFKRAQRRLLGIPEELPERVWPPRKDLPTGEAGSESRKGKRHRKGAG